LASRAPRTKTRRGEVIGLDVGDANTETFWTEFLRGGAARDLVGIRLAMPTTGLNAAVMALAVIASIDLQAIDPP
jgi:transposase-like protein